jgi:hypothetical protein
LTIGEPNADAGATVNRRTTKSRSGAGFREAAEGIRTLDLLHGKQTL